MQALGVKSDSKMVGRRVVESMSLVEDQNVALRKQPSAVAANFEVAEQECVIGDDEVSAFEFASLGEQATAGKVRTALFLAVRGIGLDSLPAGGREVDLTAGEAPPLIGCSLP